MAKFKFQIQNCIDVEIEADNKEEARMQIIDNIKEYADQMANSSTVSDGEE